MGRTFQDDVTNLKGQAFDDRLSLIAALGGGYQPAPSRHQADEVNAPSFKLHDLPPSFRYAPFEKISPMSDDSKPSDSSTPRTAGTNGNGSGNRGGKPSSNRGPMFMIFGGVVVLAGLAWGAYTVIEGGKVVATDNAYVNASSAQVTPLVSASVVEADINDTKLVHKGDVLVVLDDSDAKLALASRPGATGPDAAPGRHLLLRQRRHAEGPGRRLDRRDRERAQANLEKAQKAYDDRKALAGTGAVSGEDVTTAKAGLDQALAAVATAKASRPRPPSAAAPRTPP